MKRKLAVLIGVVVMTAMLGACGGSGSGSAAPASQEPAAEEKVEEAVEEKAEEAAGEAEKAEEAVEAAAEEAADAAEEAVDAAADAATEIAAEAATAATEIAAEAATEAAAEDVLDGEAIAPQMSKMIEDLGIDALLTDDEGKKMEVTQATEEGADDKGFGFSNGEMYEYTAFLTADIPAAKEYAIIYNEPFTKVLSLIIDLTHFYKSSGVTEEQIRSLDLSQFYPGIYDMSFARANLVDCGDYYELVIAFVNLDDPDVIKEAVDRNFFTVPGYSYGMRLSAEGILGQYRNLYPEVSDYDLAQENIVP